MYDEHVRRGENVDEGVVLYLCCMVPSICLHGCFSVVRRGLTPLQVASRHAVDSFSYTAKMDSAIAVVTRCLSFSTVGPPGGSEMASLYVPSWRRREILAG